MKTTTTYSLSRHSFPVRKRPRNHNLEQQAQALYKSWFVDFEPFKEELFNDSELGRIPSSCRIIKLNELCTSITKGTTPTTLGFSFTKTGVPFVKVECISEDHTLEENKLAYISDKTNEVLSRSQIKQKDILFTIAGSLGRFCFVPSNIVKANTNQAVCIIRVNSHVVPPDYIYSLFLGGYHLEYCTKNIQQAVQANLSLGTLKNLPIVIPQKEKLVEYINIIRPILLKSEQVKEEIKSLSAYRDELLPHLMNGTLTC